MARYNFKRVFIYSSIVIISMVTIVIFLENDLDKSRKKWADRKEAFYKECLTENKQYKCDHYWSSM